jgi:hypothetical protein
MSLQIWFKSILIHCAKQAKKETERKPADNLSDRVALLQVHHAIIKYV